MKQDSERKFYYGYIIVIVACLILIVTQGTFFSFGIFFKPLSADFGWTRAMTSGAFSLCIVLMGFLGILTGRLTDRIGPRFIITAGCLFIGLGYLLVSRIGALWQFYLYYGVLIAIGLSCGYIPMVTTVPRWFVKRRGLMTGIVAAGAALGTLIMPPIANWLITIHDWRTSYTIVGIATVVIILPIAQLLRRDPSQVGQLPDGEQEIRPKNINSEFRSFSLAKAIRTRVFWIFTTTQFCFGFCLFVIMVHIVPHATDIGISAVMAANILAIIGGGGVIGRILMGAVGDRIGHKKALVTSFGMMLATLVSVIIIKEVWLFYLFATAFGFAYGGQSTLLPPLAADLFGLRHLSIIVGTTSTAWAIGGAIGPVIAGYIFDVSASYQLAFIISVLVCGLGLVASSFLNSRTTFSKKKSMR